MKKLYKTHEKSPSRTKSILRALSQFGSRSITMTHFLQKLLSCNKLCAIIVVGRQHKLCLPLTFVTHSTQVFRITEGLRSLLAEKEGRTVDVRIML